MNRFTVIFAVLLLLGVIFAQSGENIKNAICTVYCLVNTLLPTIAFVLFVLAGVAYAAGQFFGAEMRAKTVGWAMNMITGAIIGLILAAIGPSILGALYSGSGTLSVNCQC